MKQFKHHNVFIYYTKYSFIKYKINQRTQKILKLLIHQNAPPPLASITASQILCILSIKDWR